MMDRQNRLIDMAKQIGQAVRFGIPVLGFGLFASVFLSPQAFDFRGTMNRDSCQSRLKLLYGQIQLYAADYDGLLPPVRQSRFPALGCNYLMEGDMPSTGECTPIGWVDALFLYSRSTTTAMCPLNPNPSGLFPNQRHYTAFWLNANFSKARLSDTSQPDVTVLVGDGADGRDLTDAAYAYMRLPARWLTDQKSPAYRHMGRANYLMANGAIQWLCPQEVQNFGGRQNSFALR